LYEATVHTAEKRAGTFLRNEKIITGETEKKSINIVVGITVKFIILIY
jgi:hypothetical protein